MSPDRKDRKVVQKPPPKPMITYHGTLQPPIIESTYGVCEVIKIVLKVRTTVSPKIADSRRFRPPRSKMPIGKCEW